MIFFVRVIGFQKKIKDYLRLLKPSKDELGNYQEPDTRSVCISLNKYVNVITEDHEEIITSTNNQVRTFIFQQFKNIT